MGMYYCDAAAATGSSLTIAALAGSASIRPKIHELVVGFTSTPDDRQIDLALKRFTTAISGGTAVSASNVGKCDPDTPNPTSVLTVGTLSSEPTKSAQALALPIYQRQTLRLVLDVSRPLLGVKAANNGLLLESVSVAPSGTPTCKATIFWEE